MPTERFPIRDLARIAVFAAVIAVLGLVPPVYLFGGAVPITAQTLGVMLAGAVLGPMRGAASVATLLALVAAGLPLLSGGRGGIGVFLGPTGGYLLGWIFGALTVGALLRVGARRPRWWRTALAALLGGVLVVYAFGVPVQSLVTGVGLPETLLSSLVFVPGDLLKVVLTAVVVRGLWAAYPPAFSWPRPTDRAEPIGAEPAEA
ncbi:MAG: biotin transporter BioY [Pseudoclavibacter sp.]|nr:biotin transporter BioY [Pseudoclavibacter sp.]